MKIQKKWHTVLSMYDNYSLVPFTETMPETQLFFDDIDMAWFHKGGMDPIAPNMKTSIFHDTKYDKFPYLLSKDGEYVGITWVELSTPTYGNITLHVPEEKHVPGLIAALKKKSYFDNKIMELVHVQETSAYKDACFQQQLIPNIRQRMCLWLNSIDYFQEEETPFVFRPLTIDDKQWAGKLSVEAHKVSKDYVHYKEMLEASKRIALEQKVWNGWYGNIIESASVAVEYQGKPVGFISTVGVKCWGYDKIPWIFDICIDPAFHGQGIGKALSKYAINNLIEDKYEIMGLAVTLTNQYAIALYKTLEFQFVDVFYEFMQPVSENP